VIPAEIRPQVDAALDELRGLLADDLVGVYLHGSAVLGCFGPHSDIDLVAVSQRALGVKRRRRLVEALLGISAPYEPAGPARPIELDLLLASALRRWRYPTPFELHYGESFRASFEAGELEPWESRESHDLAAHVTVLRQAGVTLYGTPIDDLFPDVPEADYVDALTHDLAWCREHFANVPRYGVLSIARIWATLATGVPQSKTSGAEWALPKLPAGLRPVLEHGHDLYVDAESEERWQDLALVDYVEYVAAEIGTIA
jgi:predicted nucleotidyltransferase